MNASTHPRIVVFFLPMPAQQTFDPHCRKCSRLSALLDEVKREYPRQVGAAGGTQGAPAEAGAYAFGHGARHALPQGLVLYDSYHCSRYNTQTRRLTEVMFHAVFERIRDEITGE